MIIWTDHAMDRLRERKLSQSDALATIHHPDKKVAGKQSGTTEYYRQFGRSNVCVVTALNERHEMVVISCWVNPPFPGTKDEQKHRQWLAYQKAPWWKKWLLTFKYQIGL